MAILESLLEQKRELEDRLADGDLKAEAALVRLDKAIASRKLKINHSQQRIAAVKTAVAAGVPVENARKAKPAKKSVTKNHRPGQRGTNRFE